MPALFVDFAVSEPDPSAWDADTAVAILQAAHYRRLVRTSALLVRDLATAEEVVQDAFVALYTRWGTAARPRSRRRLPAAGRDQRLPLGPAPPRHGPARGAGLRAVPDISPDPAGDVSARRDVLAALADLPERQREVLVLRYYGDLSEAEIAAALGVSRGAVKSYASRGAAALRPILETLR